MAKSGRKSKTFPFSGNLQSHKMRYCVKTKQFLKFIGILEYITIALTLLLMYCGLGSNTCAFVQESLTHCRTVLLSEFHLFVSAADFCSMIGRYRALQY